MHRPVRPEHEPGLDRVEDREVELRTQRVEQRPQVHLGAADLAGRAVQQVEHVRPVGAPLVEGELERGEGHAQRVLRPLARVGVAEEPVARVQHRRGRCHALGALGPERAPTPVVHERRVLDEVAEPDARGAEAEVDLLAVALAERDFVEVAAQVERPAGDVHAEPDAGDHLGAEAERVAGDEGAAAVDVGLLAVERERGDDRARQRADRAEVGERRDRGDVATCGRVGEAVQPARRSRPCRR